MTEKQDSFLVIRTTCGLVALRHTTSANPKADTLLDNEKLLEVVMAKPGESFVDLTKRADDASRYHAAMLDLKPVLVNGTDGTGARSTETV